MKRQGIAEALRDAIAEEMERDPRVFCIGEDIGVPGGWGGAFTVTLGLEQKFPDRVINTPIAELGFFGAATGAAIIGMRPIVDVQYGDFLFLASDQIINNAARLEAEGAADEAGVERMRSRAAQRFAEAVERARSPQPSVDDLETEVFVTGGPP